MTEAAKTKAEENIKTKAKHKAKDKAKAKTKTRVKAKDKAKNENRKGPGGREAAIDRRGAVDLRSRVAAGFRAKIPDQ
jgi:hypothetical protein